MTVHQHTVLLRAPPHHAGLDAPTASPADVAAYTTRTMLRSVPAAVPGIHFLSGIARFMLSYRLLLDCLPVDI